MRDRSSHFKGEELKGAADQIGIAIILAALLLFAATFAGAASLDETLAKRKPEASVNLASTDGVKLVQGEWRYSDIKIIEVDFKAPGVDGQPGATPNRTYDFTPHAGRADFDDSKWEVIDPTTLDKRRSAGKLAFNWYRIRITIPERVGTFDPTGSTVVFSTSLDDYAEIWVDSEIPRAAGGLWIVSPEGKHLGTIIAPKHPHNMAWGGDDGKTLYLTAQGSLYRMPLNVPGVRPTPAVDSLSQAK